MGVKRGFLVLILLVMLTSFVYSDGMDMTNQANTDEEAQKIEQNKPVPQVGPDFVAKEGVQGTSSQASGKIGDKKGNEHRVKNAQRCGAGYCAEKTSVNKVEATAVETFIYNSETDWQASYAAYLSTPSHTIIAGNNIKQNGNCLSVKQGETVQREQTTTSEVKEYENCDEVIKVDEAKAVSVDNQIFSDIKDSEFHLNEENQLTYAEVESQTEDNEFNLKGGTTVISDTGEVFEATFSEDGKTIETSDQIEIDHGLETITTITEEPQYNITLLRNQSNETNVTEIKKGKNKVTINNELGVVKLFLAPTSRYINYHNGTRYKPPFSFYIPQGYNFTLEIRKHPEQIITLNLSECTQCGIIDYIEKKAFLKGSFEFERLDTQMPIFTNIVRSFDQSNSFVLNLDDDMDKVTEALFSGEFGSLISGRFEVVGKDSDVYYKFMNKNSIPWIIEKIMPNVLIYDNGMLQRSLPHNTLRLYAMNTTAKNEFIATYNDWLTLTNKDLQTVMID